MVIFLTATAVWFVWPSSSYPARAGAILVLNGSGNGARAQLGIALAEKKVAPVLLYSLGDYSPPSEYPPYCPKIPGTQVVCFSPQPSRTIGEIAYAEHYAASHGITSLVIVAGHAQGTRARLLARRCFTGRSYVVVTGARWYQVPAQAAYEWGALTKALFFDTGC